MKFNEINLPQIILKNLEKMGFDEMTPIQEATYSVITSGNDLCALAETGSGKTAACAVPLIQKINPSVATIQGLIIVPTRELCIQYVKEIKKITANSNINSCPVYGGFDKHIQIANLKQPAHILVATPGRLIDLIYDRVVDLSQVKCVILDEADELLKVGFLQDIEFIFSCMIHEHQTLFFSATMSEEIKKLTCNHLKNPKHISLVTQVNIPKNIEHYFTFVKKELKETAMTRYFDKEQDVKQVIIFCDSRHIVEKLFYNMRKIFKNIDYIHAGLLQTQRSLVFTKFKNKKIRFLIATDVAGRGLDFSDVTHVVNWKIPRNEEAYTHRTGRTGRMGRKGKVFNFVTKEDMHSLKSLIRKTKITPSWVGKSPFERETVPQMNYSNVCN